METKRTQKAAKNALFGVISYLVLTVSTLITRWVFVAQFDQLGDKLGTELSGVESLFKAVISMLALAELGMGTGLVYLLYKPIATGDRDAVRRVLTFYKRAYQVVAGVILAIGGGMCFFIRFFAADTRLSALYLGAAFFLYMLDTLASYLFAHQRAMMVADQKNYLNNVNEVIMNFLTMLIQVAALLWLPGSIQLRFAVYILIRVACRVAAALLIHRNFVRLYPDLAADPGKESLDPETRRGVFKTLYAMLFHKVGGVANHKAAILIISRVIGTVVNGMYSYYLIITDAVTALVTQIFSGITASFGDYLTGGDLEAAHQKFRVLYYLNFVISSTCATAIWLLIQPFIGLWMGKENLLSGWVALLVAAYFYCYSLRRVIFLVRDSTGLYRPDRYLPLVEMALNVGLGLVGALLTGKVEYVLLGNLISMAAVPLWVQPVVVYRHVFRRSPGWYFARYGLYGLLTAGGMAAGWWICGRLPAMHPILELAVRAGISLILSAAVCLLPFCRTEEFRYLKQLAVSFLHKRRKTS